MNQDEFENKDRTDDAIAVLSVAGAIVLMGIGLLGMVTYIAISIWEGK